MLVGLSIVVTPISPLFDEPSVSEDIRTDCFSLQTGRERRITRPLHVVQLRIWVRPLWSLRRYMNRSRVRAPGMHLTPTVEGLPSHKSPRLSIIRDWSRQGMFWSVGVDRDGVSECLIM